MKSAFWIAGCFALLAGCGGKPKGPPPIAFPAGFLWGVSTAAEQSEGGNTTNDWYAFEGMGRVPPVGLADNMYALYDTDAANAQAIGANAFRLTFEWARLVPARPPDPANLTVKDLDGTALAHYRTVLASLHAHGLTPLVTLTHYTLPAWVDNPAAYDSKSNSFTDGSLGAWTNPATATAFASYAGLMAQQFGGQVTYWLTENEPVVDLVAGYLAGVFPPGLTDFSLTAKPLPGGVGLGDVVQNLIAGHAAAYHAIKAAEPNAQVSLAKNSIAFEPYTQSPANVAATARVDTLYNLLFLDAVTTGAFDLSLVGAGPMVQHPEWAHTLDFIGVNYYAHDVVLASQGLLSPLDAVPCDPVFSGALPGLFQSLGCPAQGLPEAPGFTALLLEYQARYNLPILVTENGTAAPPTQKAAYLVQNLLAVHQAISQGAQLLGYSFWTLDHDYEWGDGYHGSFGMYELAGAIAGPDGGLPPGLDGGAWAPGPATDFTRIAQHPAVDVYAEIADGGVIPQPLISAYAPDGG